MSPPASTAAVARAMSCAASAPSGPQPSLTAVKPSSRSLPTRSRTTAGSSGISIEAYARTLSRSGVPISSRHGLAGGLALDVPERDVDPADRVQSDPAPTDVDQAAVHLLPEALGFERVLADEQVVQAVRDRVRAGRVDERADGLRRRVDLADAGDALVGLDEDDQIVLAPVGDAVVEHRLA